MRMSVSKIALHNGKVRVEHAPAHHAESASHCAEAVHGGWDREDAGGENDCFSCVSLYFGIRGLYVIGGRNKWECA